MNRGIAVPVAVSVPMPAGVQLVDPGSGDRTAAGVAFAFPLGVGEVKTVRWWIRLPAAAGPVVLQAIVSATHGSRTFTVTPALTIAVVGPEPLDALQLVLATLEKSYPARALTLRLARTALGVALKACDPVTAIDAALVATDLLDAIPESWVADVRVRIDRWLRWAAQSAYTATPTCTPQPHP
jgi:hypothetical protein